MIYRMWRRVRFVNLTGRAKGGEEVGEWESRERLLKGRERGEIS